MLVAKWKQVPAAMFQHLVESLHRRLSTHSCGAPVLRVSEVETFFPSSPPGGGHQTVQNPVAQGGVETQEQHSYIGIPLVQMG
jgi:hypothetical protein